MKPYLDTTDNYYLNKEQERNIKTQKSDTKIGIISLVLIVAFIILLIVPWFTVYGATNSTEANRLGRQINCLFWGNWNGTDCIPKLIIPSAYGSEDTHYNH